MSGIYKNKDDNKVQNEYVVVNSFDEWLSEVRKSAIDDPINVYRGQDKNWDLEPKVFRQTYEEIYTNKKYDEKKLIVNAVRRYPYQFKDCNKTVEILFHLQHNGIPTRLLDVSFNPLKALYFAIENKLSKYGKESDEKEWSYFYIIGTEELEPKTLYSDVISALSCYAKTNKKVEQGMLFTCFTY